MKKLFLIIFISGIIIGCRTIVKDYTYGVDKQFINKKWVETESSISIKNIIVYPELLDRNHVLNSYIRSITIYENRHNRINHKIIFKNNIKIIYNNRTYIYGKNSVETYKSDGIHISYSSYISTLKKLNIKINSDFILKIGWIEVDGKKTYIPPLYFRKYLYVYSWIPLIDGFNPGNESTEKAIYRGWANEYKGK